MELDEVQKAYSRWAKVYDLVFGPLFVRARKRAIALLEQPAGARILEVGVGTGLSLAQFPRGHRVVGLDISRPMLKRALGRVGHGCMGLVEGDAVQLPFPDGGFDAVLATFVVSAVPDSISTLAEMRRVTLPGGPIVLLNHFTSNRKAIAAGERALSKTTEKLLGFHADFPLEPLIARTGLQVESVESVPPLGYWKALRCVTREVGG